MEIERQIVANISLTNSELAEEVLCMNIVDIADLFNKISMNMIESDTYRADVKRLVEEMDKYSVEFIQNMNAKINQYYSE